MVDLYKKLESLERGEKREKWSQIEFLVFPFSIFLFLSSLFHVNILLYLHKRSSGNRFLAYVLLTENKNLSSYLRLYKKRYYSNFRVFFVKATLHAMFLQLYFQLLLRRLFRNL